MYPSDNDEERLHTESASENVGESAQHEQPRNKTTYTEQPQNVANYTEQLQSEAQLQNEAVYSAPQHGAYNYNEKLYNNNVAYNVQTYVEPIHSEQIHSEQTYSESINSVPAIYNEQPYNAPLYNAPVYSEPLDTSQNMYSPGICVNPPYPPLRSNGGASYEKTPQRNGTAHNGAPQERAHKLGGLVRAICLVVVCALFSGIAAYAVMDYRIDRGDFAAPTPVILGSSADFRADDSFTTTVATGSTMLAQDIYDMARTQVVGVVTEVSNMFSFPGLENATAPVSGTGFIISSDGFILTNYHVIEIAHVNNLPLAVILNDGTTYDAEIIGFERDNDVAVIKIDAQGLNPVIIGDSDKIRVGQTIYAIGNPFGDLVNTMTDGIISALDRVVSVEGKSIRTFQFSAPVNRGNSGGPIYNTHGEVLGIVTAKVVRGNVEGIGFAIPINDAIEIAVELIEHGYISGRPFIGIIGQTVSPAQADYLGWVVGAYIRNVSPDSAAETAGIAVGDIVIGLGDVEVDSMNILRSALRDYSAGDTTTITIWRDGEILDLSITFDEDMYAGQPQGRPSLVPDSPNPFEDIP